MNKKRDHKPVIETIINTSALALTSFGVMTITKGSPNPWDCLARGLLLITFGAGLEWFKYYGRNKGLW